MLDGVRVQCTNVRCGAVRFVSARQARRLQTHPAKYCPSCRTEDSGPSEEDRLYWLQWAGCQVPDGMTALAYVEQYGCPAALVEIAACLDTLPTTIA